MKEKERVKMREKEMSVSILRIDFVGSFDDGDGGYHISGSIEAT